MKQRMRKRKVMALLLSAAMLLVPVTANAAGDYEYEPSAIECVDGIKILPDMDVNSRHGNVDEVTEGAKGTGTTGKHNTLVDGDIEAVSDKAIEDDTTEARAGRSGRQLIYPEDFEYKYITLDITYGGYFFSRLYNLGLVFRICNNVHVYAGDFFDIPMRISSNTATIDIPTGPIPISGAPFDGYIIREGDYIIVRIIFDRNMDNNIVGTANIQLNITFGESGYIYWEFDGFVFRGYANPTLPRPPGFFGRPQRYKTGSHLGGGIFSWTVRLNGQGASANNYFGQFGTPSAPPVIIIEDIMEGGHNLYGSVFMTSVNIQNVWVFFQDAANDPVRQNQINSIIGWEPFHITDWSVFTTQEAPYRTSAGGFYIFHPGMFTFINNLASGAHSVEGLVEVIPASPIPNPEGGGFIVEVPSEFFDYSMVSMFYNSRTESTDPAGTFSNRLRFRGGLSDSYGIGHSITVIGQGQGGDDTGNIVINKLNYANHNEPLAGAIFNVRRYTEPLRLTPEMGADAYGNIRITSGNDGIAQTLYGLGSFTTSCVFVITEVNPPVGFEAMTGEIRISINPTNNETTILNPEEANGLFRLDNEGNLIVYNRRLISIGQQYEEDEDENGKITVATNRPTTNRPAAPQTGDNTKFNFTGLFVAALASVLSVIVAYGFLMEREKKAQIVLKAIPKCKKRVRGRYDRYNHGYVRKWTIRHYHHKKGHVYLEPGRYNSNRN